MLETTTLERIAAMAAARGLGHEWSAERDVLTVSDRTTASFHRTLVVRSPAESEEIWFELGLGIRVLQVMEEEKDAELAFGLAEDIFAGAVREVVVIPPVGPPVTTEWFVRRADGLIGPSASDFPIHYEGTIVVIEHGPWPSRQFPQDLADLPTSPHPGGP